MKSYLNTTNAETTLISSLTRRFVESELRRFLRALLTAAILAASGCATNGEDKMANYSAERDPLYDGISAITFDNVLIGGSQSDLEKLGDQALRQGEQDKAIYAYLRATQNGGDKAVLFSKIGTLHQARGNHDLAFSAFSQALEANPDYIPALEGIGLVYLKRQQHSEAQSYLELSLELDQLRLRESQSAVETGSNNPNASDARGVPRFQKVSAPLESFNLPPYDHDSPHRAYNGLGILSDLAGNYEQALQYFRVADAIRPHSAITQNNFGYSYYLSGNLAMAEYHFLKALNIDPSFKRSWCNLALVYNRQGHRDDALSTLAQVMDEAQAYNTLGYLNMLAGNYHEADQLLQEAIALSPSYYEQAHDNLNQNRKRSNQ